MDDQPSLSHTRWERKYHIVFIPKCRRKMFYGHIREELGRVLAELARQSECRIERQQAKDKRIDQMRLDLK